MSDHTLIIIIALVGFMGLAALLLVPVYRFLKREEKMGRKWTAEHASAARETGKPPEAREPSDTRKPPEAWEPSDTRKAPDARKPPEVSPNGAASEETSP